MSAVRADAPQVTRTSLLILLAATFPAAHAVTPPKKKASSPAPASAAKTSSAPTARPASKSTPSPRPSPRRSPAPGAKASAEAGRTTAEIDPAAPSPAQVSAAPNASLSPDDLVEFDQQPSRVQQLLAFALDLTRRQLTYAYGSADPADGGMDCSGFIYYTLRASGLDAVPRQASEQYKWVRRADEFDAVLSKKRNSFELDDLKPGDLLFWTGTYAAERDPPVTHTMIYLGTERATGQRVMVGSSDGRTYRGKSRWGVSVFDFQGGQTSRDPAKTGRSGFVGYATIPGLRD